jgi:hypothetical protein
MGDAAAAPAAERDTLFRKLRAKPENKVCAEGECVCVCVRGCVRPLVGSERGRVAVPPPPRDWRASLCVACVVCASPPSSPQSPPACWPPTHGLHAAVWGTERRGNGSIAFAVRIARVFRPAGPAFAPSTAVAACPPLRPHGRPIEPDPSATPH